MIEEWRDVVGYEGLYQVSSLGQVRSLDREVPVHGSVKKIKGAILSQSIRDDGYRQVSLWKEGTQKNGLVHQLVARAFIGPRPPGQQVRHKDGDQSDNRADTLLYGTVSQNCQDTVAHGRHNRLGKDHSGENNANSKLTADQVKMIRRRLADGASKKLVAAGFGVSYSLIKRINRRELWPDV